MKNYTLDFHGDFMKSINQVSDLSTANATLLKHILNQKHSLYAMANSIDWSIYNREFGNSYADKRGCKTIPIRLLVGLHYLKNTYFESDESVVAKFIENPYWQYFCGNEIFQHQLPIEPIALKRWRKHIGPTGMDKLIKGNAETAIIRKGHYLTSFIAP